MHEPLAHPRINSRTVAYGLHCALDDQDFAWTGERVFDALKTDGLSVQAHIDVKATKKVTLLGMCKPWLLHRALDAELDIGLLLPCDVIWHEVAVEIHNMMSAGTARTPLTCTTTREKANR
ncbi:DUF302 domain-containing protein [Allopusillimonas ginsengisoli]|nr:DUF302 domain-containing protein [Allopusillimonas ginsengisoli]